MRPTHPGKIVREDVLPALNLSVSEAARLLRVSRQTLHRLFAGTIGVSPEMAVRYRHGGTNPLSRLEIVAYSATEKTVLGTRVVTRGKPAYFYEYRIPLGSNTPQPT
jgi:addiction module HigA family antidote